MQMLHIDARGRVTPLCGPQSGGWSCQQQDPTDEESCPMIQRGRSDHPEKEPVKGTNLLFLFLAFKSIHTTIS